MTAVLAPTVTLPMPVREHPAPYIAALACGELTIDHSYQRDLDTRRRDRMAAEFDRALLGVLEVSDRGDGTYAVLDGQHRWAAAHARHGDQFHLVCQIHTGLTTAEEARVFYEIDRRRTSLTPWARWRARSAAGDPIVVEIEGIVAGFKMRVEDGAGEGTIRAAAALESVYGLGGRPLLTTVLSVLTAAYGIQIDAYDRNIVQGVADVLRSYRVEQELSIDRLIAALQGIVPRQLKARAAALREANRGTMSRLVAQVIVDLYNRQLGRKLQPFADRIKPFSKSSSQTLAAKGDLVRKWAESRGYNVPAERIPTWIHEAYDKAHPAGTTA